MGGGAGAGEGVEDEGVVVGTKLKHTLDQGHRLGRDGAFAVLQHAHFNQCLLRVLRVAHFVVEPQGLRGTALFDVRQKPLKARHIVAVIAPPNSTLGIELNEFLLADTPVSTRWWTIENSA